MFRQRIYDANLVLRTAGLVKTSAMATVGSGGPAVARTAVNVTLDVGTGWGQGAFVVQVAPYQSKGSEASEVGVPVTGRKVAKIQLRGGTTKAFIREVVLAQATIALESVAATSHGMSTTAGTLATGQTHEFIMPFCNEYDGTIYQYLRCYHVFLGTWATGINYTAWVSKL